MENNNSFKDLNPESMKKIMADPKFKVLIREVEKKMDKNSFRSIAQAAMTGDMDNVKKRANKLLSQKEGEELEKMIKDILGD